MDDDLDDEEEAAWNQAVGRCVVCGRNPALGFAAINDDWYCHPDEGESCYESGVRDSAVSLLLDPDGVFRSVQVVRGLHHGQADQSAEC